MIGINTINKKSSVSSQILFRPNLPRLLMVIILIYSEVFDYSVIIKIAGRFRLLAQKNSSQRLNYINIIISTFYMNMLHMHLMLLIYREEVVLRSKEL